MFSIQCLQPGLRGYLILFAPLAFVPHRQIRSCNVPSPVVSPIRIKTFYRYPNRTRYISRSQAWKYFLHATWLSHDISQETFQTSYERFKPNKCGYHLDRRYYRGGWHRSCPVLIPLAFCTREKFLIMRNTLVPFITLSSIVKFS